MLNFKSEIPGEVCGVGEVGGKGVCWLGVRGGWDGGMSVRMLKVKYVNVSK